jgi:hypothetical protein
MSQVLNNFMSKSFVVHTHPEAKKEGKKTLDLLRTKSVAILGLFVLLMAAASAYSNYRRVLADTSVEFEAPQCTVYFDPGTNEVAVGETFAVDVLVDDVSNLWGYEIGLMFDRSVLEYVGAKTPHWRFISGQKEYLFWVAGASPQNGQVELMEFTFKAEAAGSSSLGFYVHKLATLKYWDAPKDYVGWPIPHMLSQGLVTVS